jgi:hypothetical protein
MVKKATQKTGQGGALPEDDVLLQEQTEPEAAGTPEDVLTRAREYLRVMDEATRQATAAAEKAEAAAAAAEGPIFNVVGALPPGGTLVVTMSETLSGAARANARQEAMRGARKAGVKLVVLPRGIEVVRVDPDTK